jgi:hypothetical protein
LILIEGVEVVKGVKGVELLRSALTPYALSHCGEERGTEA